MMCNEDAHTVITYIYDI